MKADILFAGIVGSRPSQVKPKTMKLVIAAFLSTQLQGVGEKTRWLGIGIMCLRGATCLPGDPCLSELAQ